LPFIFSLIFANPSIGQESTEVNQQLIDMKLELLNSQIELFVYRQQRSELV